MKAGIGFSKSLKQRKGFCKEAEMKEASLDYLIYLFHRFSFQGKINLSHLCSNGTRGHIYFKLSPLEACRLKKG